MKKYSLVSLKNDIISASLLPWKEALVLDFKKDEETNEDLVLLYTIINGSPKKFYENINNIVDLEI